MPASVAVSADTIAARRTGAGTGERYPGKCKNGGVAQRPLRFLYAATYAGFAALGAALLARPAASWFRGLGLFGPALPVEGVAGWASAALLLLLAAATVGLAIATALGRKPGLSWHAGFLGLVACAVALRAAGLPQVRPDPEPALREALRTAAAALDASYAVDHRYDPPPGAVQAALDALPPAPFRHHGKSVRYTARLTRNAAGAQTDPVPGDPPATVYAVLQPGGQGAWLSVTSLRGGRVEVLPAIVEARSGSHSEPGETLLLPRYPGARATPR